MKALNVKIALLTCVGFTAGMCWLVSRVGGPATAGGGRPAAALASSASPTASPARGESREALRRANPIDTARRDSRNAQEIAVARSAKLGNESLDAMLPPVSVPNQASAKGAIETAELAYAPPVVPAHSDSYVIPEFRMPNAGELVASFPNPTHEVEEPDRVDVAEQETLGRPDALAPHVVGRGENLASIAAKKLGSADPATIRAILSANPKLKNRPDKLYVGETIVMPGGRQAEVRKVASAAPKSEKSTPQSKVTKGAKPGRKSPVVTSTVKPDMKRPTSKSAGKSKPTAWYTVKQNDSLSGIAKRLLKDERRWREIQALNGLKPGQRVAPGTKIKVPASRDA